MMKFRGPQGWCGNGMRGAWLVVHGVCLMLMMFTAQNVSAFWLQPTPALDHRGTEVAWLSYVDARLDSGERYKSFDLPVRMGESIEIRVESPHFEPYLMLRGETLRVDAAAAKGSRRAVLRHQAKSDATLSLLVTTAQRGDMGVFRVEVIRDGALVDPTTNERGLAVELHAGVTVEGSVAAPAEDADSARTRFSDTYRYVGKAGERVRIRAFSEDFVPALLLIGANFSSRSGLVERPKGEALLEALLPEDGVYMLRVFSEKEATVGAYSLELQRLPELRDNAVEAAELRQGAQVQGRLQEGDLNRSHGQWVDRYVLDLEADALVDIALKSSEFDAYLYVVFPDHGGEENDDANTSTTDARIRFRAPTAGRYQVFATSYRSGETGHYMLKVDAGRSEPVPSNAALNEDDPSKPSLLSGQAHHAMLENDDLRMNDGSFYKAYRLQVQTGEHWVIDLKSEVFDTHLELRGSNGFTRTNDDRQSTDTNAQIRFEAEASESLTIYATSHVPGAAGAYTIRAERVSADVPVAPPHHGRVVALMVGISQYGRADLSDLSYCAEDATKIQQALTATGMLAPESVTLVNAAATRDAVYAAFESLAQVVGPNDVFVFFYSGHGGQAKSDDPRELDGLDETLVLVDGDIRDTELADLVMTIQPRLTLVALDSCYSGGFRAELLARKNQIGVFSSEEDVASLVASEFKAGGYLAHIIARGLSSASDRYPADGAVTVDELLQFIRREWADAGRIVAEDSGFRSAHQHLVIERGYTSPQDIVLIRPPSQR